MLMQNLLGISLLIVSILVTCVFIGIHSAALNRYQGWLSRGVTGFRQSFALALIVFWMALALSASVCLWAFAFLAVGEFQTLEESLYFSLVSFTTLGFGDVLVSKDWRILSGITAANGLILFSLLTAVLFEFTTMVRAMHQREHQTGL